MKNMILLDIETMDFSVDSGIYEVALKVIEDNEVISSEHFADIEDESLIHHGMGYGYSDISNDEKHKKNFRNIINKYNYPIVAHNVAFDRKFLVHYDWLDEDYECYDSIRAIKYANPNLFSYSLNYLISFYDIEQESTHLAIDDVDSLHEVIKKAQPDTWVPLYKVSPSKLKNLMKTTINLEGESTVFEGKRIVFTGASPFPRILMKEIATKCGAAVTSSVSKKTDLLVCGENPGSKLDKARELDLEIQTDEWFIDAVSQDIDLEKSSIIRTNINGTGGFKNSYTLIPEFENKIINTALLPTSVQKKVDNILINDMKVNKISKGTSHSVNSDFIIHSDNRDYVLLENAEENQIKTIPLSKFNQMILK